jgi:transposase InsO family protein
MMMDAGLVAASPASVYRVLSQAGLLARWNRSPSRKGTGFQPPVKPHEHWHTDISHLNVHGTFYYLCAVLDGFSRYIVHWEIREAMTEQDVQIVLQRAHEKYPEARPRIISDNGPQFIARDFKEFIRLMGMTHVRTSPYYPQSNGKQERWHATLKQECLRPQTPLSLQDGQRIVAHFVTRYNDVRLHSAIGYVAPKDKLEGRAEAILAERERKLQAARDRRAQMRRAGREGGLTEPEKSCTLCPVGETEAGAAGEQPARDNRPGRRAFVTGESAHSPRPCALVADAQSSIMPEKTPGSGAEPQNPVNARTPGGPESLIGVRRFSISR